MSYETYNNVTRVNCYWWKGEGWHVFAYDGDGLKVGESHEAWFPLDVSFFTQEQPKELVEALSRHFPEAMIGVTTGSFSNTIPKPKQLTAEDVRKAVDSVCQLFSILPRAISEERLNALRTLEKLAKDYGKKPDEESLSEADKQQRAVRFWAKLAKDYGKKPNEEPFCKYLMREDTIVYRRHPGTYQAKTDWQEAKAGVLYPMSFDRATRIDDIVSSTLVQSIHIDTRVIFERGQPHALVFPLPALGIGETVRFTFATDTRFRLHLTQVTSRHA